MEIRDLNGIQIKPTPTDIPIASKPPNTSKLHRVPADCWIGPDKINSRGGDLKGSVGRRVGGLVEVQYPANNYSPRNPIKCRTLEWASSRCRGG